MLGNRSPQRGLNSIFFLVGLSDLSPILMSVLHNYIFSIVSYRAAEFVTTILQYQMGLQDARRRRRVGLFTCRSYVGTNCTVLPRFLAKDWNSEKRFGATPEEFPVRRECPARKGTKGNALKREKPGKGFLQCSAQTRPQPCCVCYLVILILGKTFKACRASWTLTTVAVIQCRYIFEM